MSDTYQAIWEAINKHKFSEAEQLIKCLPINSDDEDRNKQVLQAIVLTKQDDTKAALGIMNKIISKGMPIANDYNVLGNIYLHDKNYSEAEKYYAKALALDPDYAHAQDNLANVYYLQQKWDQCKAVYQTMLDHAEKNTQNYYRIIAKLASLAMQMQQLDKALTILDKALDTATANKKLLSLWAQCQYLQNNYQAVIDRFDTYTFTNKDDLDSLWFLANAYFNNHQIDEATSCAVEIVKVAERYDQINAFLGHCYLKQHNYDNAIKYYLRELESNPTAEVYFNLGVLFEAKQQQTEAVNYYKEAIKRDEQYRPACINLANLYLAQNLVRDAKDYYELAQQIKSDESTAFILKALNPGAKHPAQPPQQFVQSLFDQYAPYYDEHLQSLLKFKVPHEICALIINNHLTSSLTRHSKILDLGCGSGLMAAALRENDILGALTGVDISPLMLELAEQKNIYQQLLCKPIEKITTELGLFNLIIASDVLPYLGDLKDLFQLITTLSAAGCYFIFSVETVHEHEQVDYVLQQTLRYAYHPNYISKLAADNHWQLVDQKRVTLRENHKKPVDGEIYLFNSRYASNVKQSDGYS